MAQGKQKNTSKMTTTDESYCRKCNEKDGVHDRFLEQKQKLASLIAAVNWAISEYPSDRACQYLNPIIEKLFSK